MASSIGTSSGSGSGSYTLQNSGSEEDLQQVIDERKRKRMVSNRESARGSRMRKQKHLDDLMSQLSHLINENNQILRGMSITTQNYLNIEAENSILRARLSELRHTLQSLTQTISVLSYNTLIESFTADESCNYMDHPIMTEDIMQY